MRNRERTIGNYAPAQILTQYRPADGSWDDPTLFRETLQGSVRKDTISDVVVADFRVLKNALPRKVLPYNNCVISSVLETRFAGQYICNLSTIPTGPSAAEARYYGTQWLECPLLPLPTLPDRIIDAAVLGACAKARAAIHDSLTEVAEFPQTVKLFLDTAKRFANLRSQVFRRALQIAKDPRKAPTALSQAWLEYRYGWMPIVYSLQDIQKAFTSGDRGLVKKKEIVTWEDESHDISTSIPWDIRGTGTVSRTSRSQFTVRGFALGQFANGEGKFGFDPLVTAWELVSYSFVLDWFFTIGSWIQTWTPFGSGELLVSGYSSRLKGVQTLEAQWSVDKPYPNASVEYCDGMGYFKTVIETNTYVRSPYAPPILPGLSVNLNVKRYIDAVALVMQLLRKSH